MRNQETYFRTKELSLATTLSLQGHTYQFMERRGGNTCVWVFDRTPQLMVVVKEYLAGDSQVEPKAFALEMARVRKGMYRYLDGSAAARG